MISNERLMRDREFYAPQAAPTSPGAALAGWSERVSLLNELGSARELAGLSDAELSALEAEFLRCQMRPRAHWERDAVRFGAALTVLACLGLAFQGLIGPAATDARLVQAVSVAVFLVGLIPLGAGLFAAFSNMHLDLSYGTTGLLVGQLDERHPWLYKAMGAARHPSADEYRQRVLAERGMLRGADHVLMREIVRTHEALEQMEPARAVAEKLQLLPPSVEAGPPEPKLVRIVAGSR